MADSDLVSLYRGALIGQALSRQMGQAEATGTDIQTGIRQAYLQSGIATGRIKPASLSPQDASLLSAAVEGFAVPRIPQPHGEGLLSTLATPFKIALNTGGDLVRAVESLPAGVEQLGKSAYKSAQETTPFPHSTIKGPDLGGLAKGIAKTTAQDFTHFDPMHPLYPALDIAALVSGGTSALVRGGGALSRLADAGRLGSRASVASNVGRIIPARVAEIGRSLAKLGSLERPAVPITSKADELASKGVVAPPLPIRHYSISPFRKLFVEKPIEGLFDTKLAKMPLPGFAEGVSAVDRRGIYHLNKASNVLRGRASAAGVDATAAATQGFNESLRALRDASGNDTVALEKFNALTLMRMLGAENMTPAERLDVLEEYRNKVLATGTPHVEGVPVTEESKQIKEFNRKLTSTADYRRYFSEPDEHMWGVRNAWDEAILKGLQSLNIDPHELLHRSLGPAAHIREMTPEELLREQPANVQSSMNFAMRAHDIEQALKESGGEEVPEMALIPKLAEQLPHGTQGDLGVKIKLVEQAVDSLRADLAGEHTPRELLNNAGSTGYLPGNTLAQKVAAELPGRLGVPEHVAEPFATGGLTNYFPQRSALPSMKIRMSGGPISRAMDKIKGTAPRPGLHEFRRENMSRLLDANSLGVGPFASFLEDADLSAFKAGVDRRDPYVMVRHIAQRERVLVHRLLSEPFVEKIALKNAAGDIIRVGSDEEKANVLGSMVIADKYSIISPKALQVLVQSEDKAALDVANALKDAGSVTPEFLEHVDDIANEGAMMLVRQTADEAISSEGKGIIVPNAYVQNLIKHAQVLDSSNRVGHLWQAFINKWRTAVLAYMPSWLLRTSVGHGSILFLSGVWNPVHYMQAVTYFKDGFHLPATDMRLTSGLERHIPEGIQQGMPHSEIGGGLAEGSSHGIAESMNMKNVIAPAITGAVHRVANFQRRAAFLSMFNRITKQHFAELGEAFQLPGGLRNSTNLDRTIEEHPDWVHHALNELDRVSYTFGQMAPWERRMAKNILPFWGWYKFVSKFVWTLPLTFPGRTLAIARLGQVGAANQDQLGAMPDWLRASVMFDTHDLSNVHYMSMLGLNPLGDVMNPAGGINGLIRLGQMSPVIQAALESMGYNTMTGGLESIDPASGIVEVNGKFVNIHTGKSYDSLGSASVGADVERFFGGLARSFPEARIGELAVTKGYPVYPESVPFVNERRIPTTLPKNVSPLGILAQYGGVAPKNYNLQKYQMNLLKDIRRAMSTSRKAVVKEQALP